MFHVHDTQPLHLKSSCHNTQCVHQILITYHMRPTTFWVEKEEGGVLCVALFLSENLKRCNEKMFQDRNVVFFDD